MGELQYYDELDSPPDEMAIIQRVIIYGFRGDHGKPRHESEHGDPKPVTWYNERLLVSTRHWGPSTGAGDPRAGSQRSEM